LLECDVPPSDPAVQKALAAVRTEAPKLTFTYSLCLCILFLDRLSAAKDRSFELRDGDLIRQIAWQVIAAQNGKGGWGYQCPLLDVGPQQEIREALENKTFEPGKFAGTYDDNSINQFATLALWAARKHGVRSEASLAMVAERYRKNQN